MSAVFEIARVFLSLVISESNTVESRNLCYTNYQIIGAMMERVVFNNVVGFLVVVLVNTT